MAHRLRLSADGLLISKSGRDCLSGNYDDLLMDGSRHNTRIKQAGTITGTGSYIGDYATGAGLYEITAYHGLGYIPHCNLVLQSGTGFILIDGSNIRFRFTAPYSGSHPATASTSAVAAYVLFFDRLI